MATHRLEEATVSDEPRLFAFDRRLMREDFALGRIPLTWRKPWYVMWSGVATIPTAIFFVGFGAELTSAFGTINMIIGGVIAMGIAAIAGFFIGRRASEVGLSIDLISRGAGFGFLGSALASLVYALVLIGFFAAESSLLLHGHWYSRICSVPTSMAVDRDLGPYLRSTTWYGSTQLGWTGIQTIVPWIIGIIAFIALAYANHDGPVANFLTFYPDKPVQTAPAAWLFTASAWSGLMINALVAADFGRFLSAREKNLGSAAISINMLTFVLASLLGSIAWGNHSIAGRISSDHQSTRRLGSCCCAHQPVAYQRPKCL